MGNKVEVYKWQKHEYDQYYFQTVYAGESIVRGLIALIKAKRTSGMVKLEWR